MEVTQTELADIFEVHPRSVRRWQNEEGLPSLGTGPQRTYRTRECIDWFVERKLEAAGRSGEGEGVARKKVSEARRKAAKAELEELKVREKRGELIEFDAVLDLVEDVHTRVRQRLVNLPGRRIKELTATTEIEEVREIRAQAVREILEELQDLLLEDDEDGSG